MANLLAQAAIMLCKRESASIVAATGLLFEQLKKDTPAKPLANVVISQKGGTWGEQSIPGDGFPILRSSNMRGKKVDVGEAVWCSISFQQAEPFILQSGDILVTKSSGSSDLVGKAAIFLDPNDGNTYLYSNFTLRLRPNKTIVIPEYLAWFLRSPQSFIWRYEKQQNAVGLRNLQTIEYLSQFIPVPNLDIQRQVVTYLDLLEQEDKNVNLTPLPSSLIPHRRIVARIEALAERVAAAQSLRREASDIGDNLLNASLSQITEDLLASHQPKPLEDLTLFIGDMNHEMPQGQDEGVAFISPKDFTENGKIDFENSKKISREDFVRLSRKACPKKGDILMARYGTIGAARFVETDKEFLASYSIAMIRPNIDIVDGKFLYWMSISPFVQEQAIKGIRGSGMADVGLKTIRQFMIPLLKLEEQLQLVKHLDMLQARISALRAAQAESERELAALLPSVLDRAFKGEL